MQYQVWYDVVLEQFLENLFSKGREQEVLEIFRQGLESVVGWGEESHRFGALNRALFAVFTWDIAKI